MSQRQRNDYSTESLILTSKQNDFSYYEEKFIHFSGLTEKELQQAIENITRSNLLLKLENDIFERYLARRDPEILQTIAQMLETAKRVQKITPQLSFASPVTSVSGSFISITEGTKESIASIQSAQLITSNLLAARAPKAAIKITYADRIEMVNTEIRDLEKELIKVEETSIKKKKYIQARIEENEMSIRETCKTRENFEENIVFKGVDKITGKIPAEKFIRFTEEWFKTVDTTIEQMRLKITTIKSLIRKIKLQMQQRKELGEALRAVDFEQLKVENQICIREIDEKNRYLLEMKKIVGRYSIALTKHKEKLANLTSIVNEVRSNIAFKKQEIMKLQSEKVVMKVEIKNTEKQIKSVTALVDKFEVPNVIDYIKMSIELQELRKIYKQLSRKRDIQQITFNFNRK
ncbi:coiled-coil domain-containing protein 113 [Cataglyphis hispanica]|uniref:coiled-coil domain-containing protein 113 n=1 Tax=Cataglyphis hispanica TaxID=1086592 RepID=UPI00217FDE01|nr:coiled-coil domain-containing protein 113 [Cataglyphis hispanica]